MAGDARRRVRPLRVFGFFAWPVLMLLTKRRRRGAEKIPDGGFVIGVNHISHLDPLLFGHFLYDQDISARYLAKASLFDVPVFGRLFTATGQIPVFRESRAASDAYSAAEKAVRSGACVIFYPEGTISKDPGLWPMRGKTGAARLALATGAPLVPMAQWGSNLVLPPYTKRTHFLPRKTIAVSVGDPVDLDDLRGGPVTVAATREATDRLMAAITVLLAEIRGEEPPAAPYVPDAGGDA